MSHNSDRAVRRRRRLLRMRRDERHGIENGCRTTLAAAVGLGAVLCLLAAVMRAPYALAAGDDAAAAANGCLAAMAWPVGDAAAPAVLTPFDAPARPWLAGHRGADLAARAGEEIRAPADGVVSFAGTVAGKQVVSIRHGTRLSTFEPAVTALVPGASVSRGRPFATVGDAGDHCRGACLHWGVRTGEDAYLDPVALAGMHRIALKPLKASKPVLGSG